jgi:glutamyl-Q tRNA(Asp) synthetase
MRGADLVLSTPRQMLLQRCLELPEPAYAHLPLALDCQGNKLSKSDGATPVDPRNPLPALIRAWRFLGQSRMEDAPVDLGEFWGQAVSGWDTGRIPRRAAAPVSRSRKTHP